jgi:hypothetical protein
VDLDEILYGGDDFEDDLNSILLNPLASAIPHCKTLKRMWWVQRLNRYFFVVAVVCLLVTMATKYCLCLMVTMATKLFIAVNSVKLSLTELNEVKVRSLKVSSSKLGSSTSNK